MNRRGFFAAMVYGAMGALGSLAVQKRRDDCRFVEFNPPRTSPMIHWAHGHMPIERFSLTLQELGLAVAPEQVKHGWGTRKLSGLGMYLSDTPQPNYEPITYWIPADYNSTEVAA